MEVICPSFTFVSTANAILRVGARPVFAEIDETTLGLDPADVATRVTGRTAALLPVHYAGIAPDMDGLMAIARDRDLRVVEDAAQGLAASYRGAPLGAIGDVGSFSFHETKNVTCGEGGALAVADPVIAARAEIIREKGTDRSRFLRGQIDKYSWVDIGSSFLPGELTAAFLWAQMERAEEITRRRLEIWGWYYERFADLESRALVRRPVIPAHCSHNAHMFYVLVEDLETRTRLLAELNARGVNAVFHYVPLHSSTAGRRFGRVAGPMDRTDSLSQRLVRLPLWIGMEPADVDRVAACVEKTLA
jgi:dTDP-4-amino-4,6-dideoxygalactose transaminase